MIPIKLYINPHPYQSSTSTLYAIACFLRGKGKSSGHNRISVTIFSWVDILPLGRYITSVSMEAESPGLVTFGQSHVLFYRQFQSRYPSYDDIK